MISAFVVVIGIWMLPVHLKSGKYVHVSKEEIAKITEKEKIEVLGINNFAVDGASIIINKSGNINYDSKK